MNKYTRKKNHFISCIFLFNGNTLNENSYPNIQGTFESSPQGSAY